MLSSLLLNNVALIKKQSINFKSGFNCILGQSGAGKSIIIDALSFSLGGKADKNLIRSGENALRVDAVFNNISAEAKKFLSEQDIETDDEIIITRTLSVEGKSSIKINGFPVTAKILKDLAELLADFCGQHDSVGLLNVANHMALLDKFGGKDIEALKNEVAHEFDILKEIETKISSLGGTETERARAKELLEYQIQEIDNANLKANEEEELVERFDFISAAEKIYEKLGAAIEKLDGQRDNVSALLYDSKSDLSGLENFKNIEDCRQRVENCYYEIKDVADTLEEIRQSTEFDPLEQERIDSRLDLIKNLKRKYGSNIENILTYCDKCRQELNELENNQFLLEKFQNERAQSQSRLDELCEKLTEKRKECATKLENELTKQLEDLEMKGTYFKVDIQKSEVTRRGGDSIKFLFSANLGQEAKDLHKTASGGELSRLLLAFKNVFLGKENVQTVVFDEIDSGISGHTAGKLAEKLANISKFTQVICITHTPVVASKADSFLLVEKNIVDGNTVSSVKELDSSAAVFEVARLIDGALEVSDTALEHAKKLFLEKY